MCCKNQKEEREKERDNKREREREGEKIKNFLILFFRIR